MISREEIAEKLREAGKELDKNAPRGVNRAAQSVLFELFEATSIRDSNSYSDAFNRLADLIDPTCESVGVPDNDEFMVRIVSGFMCKKCGHEAIVERNCDGWAEPPKYCPNCGARLVSDEV